MEILLYIFTVYISQEWIAVTLCMGSRLVSVLAKRKTFYGAPNNMDDENK